MTNYYYLSIFCFFITNSCMFFIILDNFINFIRSVWWRRSFVFPMMQIKVINNCAKAIQKNISISLAVFVRKIAFATCSKRSAASRIIWNEIFKLSLFIQVNTRITFISFIFKSWSLITPYLYGVYDYL